MVVRRIKLWKRREYIWSDARRFLEEQVSRLRSPNIDHMTANDKDFSTSLEMTIRESNVS